MTVVAITILGGLTVLLCHVVEPDYEVGDVVADANERRHESVEYVEFDDVWFSYDDEEQVYRGFDFEVEKGEFVAFVGQSGAGKSTVVSLLARLYELERGEIRANDAPIMEMDVHEWSEHVSVVRQNPFIFNNTLRYN